MINRGLVEGDLRTILDQAKRELSTAINCHAIATVQSFDSAKQTITASMNYQRVVFNQGNDTEPTYLDYPILVDVPVIIISGGGGFITFPIESGDTCMILFNDRDIDNWFSTGQVKPPNSPRAHSFSDGVALVGVNSMQKPITPFDPLNAVMSYKISNLKLGLLAALLTCGPNAIGVTAAGITMTVAASPMVSASASGLALGDAAASTKTKIQNSTGTLLSVLEGLIDTIKAITITGASVSVASQAALEAQKTVLEGLLE